MQLNEVILGEHVKIKSSKRVFLKDYVPHGVPFYRSKEIISLFNNKPLDDNLYISSELYSSIKEKYGVPQYKDILLTSVGTLGIPYLIREDDEFYFKDGNLTWFSGFDLNKLKPEFLYYWIQSNEGVNKLHSISIGSTQKALTMEALKKMKILIPAVDYQNKVVDILKSIDDKIKINHNIINKLEEISNLIFKNWFIDFEFPNEQGLPYKSNDGKMVQSEYGVVPLNYLVTPINELILETIGGDWGKEEEAGNYKQVVNVIRGADLEGLNKGVYSKIPRRYILKKNYLNKKIKPMDLIVEISGGSPTQSTGRISLVTNEVINKYNDRLISTNFCRILRLSDNANCYYLYYWWKHMYAKGVFFQFENGTTGIKNLDLTSFLKVNKLVLPNNEIMKKFNDLCTSNHELIFNLGQENIMLSTLRDTLLPKLLSGEIELPIKETVEN